MKRVLVILLVASCSSSTEETWDSATRSINGELFALRPTVHAIAALATNEDAASVRAVIGMCASMDTALQRIAEKDLTFHALDREPGGPHSYMTAVPSHARWLTQRRYSICQGDDWRCRDWCVTTWRGLADSVDVLAAHASKHGAYLQSLTR